MLPVIKNINFEFPVSVWCTGIINTYATFGIM